MRGVVFTELIEFVEVTLGFDAADEMIEKAKLSNKGVFTQGGNYPFENLQALVVALSEVSGQPVSVLLEMFGKHLLPKLVKIFGRDVKVSNDVLDFIDSIESYVHVEVVKKLYPDADLPTFVTQSKSVNELVIVYQSDKHLEVFAKGLMEG